MAPTCRSWISEYLWPSQSRRNDMVSSGLGAMLALHLPRGEAMSGHGLSPDAEKLDKSALALRLVSLQLEQEKKKEANLESEWVRGHSRIVPGALQARVTQFRRFRLSWPGRFCRKLLRLHLTRSPLPPVNAHPGTGGDRLARGSSFGALGTWHPILAGPA